MNTKVGYFNVFKSSKNQEWYWTLIARNHEPILQSEGYKSKQGALDGITSVRENAPLDERYQRKNAKDGQYYFNLTAGNGETIGRSEMYTTKAARDKGIESVKNEAPVATVKDLSVEDEKCFTEAKTVGAAASSGGLSISGKSNKSNYGIPVKPKGGFYGIAH